MGPNHTDRIRLDAKLRGRVNLATRARRTIKVSWTAAIVWLSYKIPSLARKWTGRPPRTNEELSARHEKTAQRMLALALDMRGVMIKMPRVCINMVASASK